MTTINAQRQLQSTLRKGSASSPISGTGAKKHVSHIKQLHEAALKRSDALSAKKTSGQRSKEITSDELVEYHLRGS